MSTEADFALIDSYLGGRASADEVQALEGRLKADSDLREAFLRYAHVDAALKTMVRPSAQQPLAAPKAKTTIWRAQTVRWAAAAVLLLAGALALWMPRSVEVRVMAVSDDAASIWPKDSTQRLREVRLESGSVQLQLDSGVTLDLNAPVHLRLADAMHATLLAGSVTADVGDLGKGFVIETSSARVVDLGTRFGVSLGSTGETDVAVFQGKVEVFGKAQPKQLASLTAGEAVRVHPSATARRLVCINTRGEAFAMLTTPPSDALVTDVKDNVDVGGRYAFYTLQTRQMGEGTRPYSTLGKPRWRAMPGSAFPAELEGADMVGTFSADRVDPALELTLKVSRPCTVYVMIDTRAETPEWVKREYVDAGFQLRSGPWANLPEVAGMTTDDTGTIYVSYRVWKRSVPQAGPVKLGAAYADPAQSHHRAMYGIAVK
ncbi:MAG: FecR domain-containing protein [Verrucomicrobiaceae bacterium]|nr:FecR domain-containing protein [Verrucomicrobiaceae bacterium]